MNTEEISIEYIDHMGSDKRICNVARVSFDKWEDEDEPLTQRDIGLINYLATGLPAADREDFKKLFQASTHWTPFAHCFISLRCTVPMWMGNQLHKHQIGLVRNEVSRRYVSSEPSFWIPNVVHAAPDNAKQGSGDEHLRSNVMRMYIRNNSEQCLSNYNHLLASGVAPEEARFCLPMNTMTTFVLSGSLMAMLRIVGQRADGHAQLAIQDFAYKLYKLLLEHFPEATQAIIGRKRG